MRPMVVTVPAVKEYANAFAISGVIDEVDGTYRYAPVGGEIEAAIAQLSHAYNERPVTLIGMTMPTRL